MAVSRALPLDALKVLFVTDGTGDCARILGLVESAVAGGVRAIQLREPTLNAATLAELCAHVRTLLEPVSGLLFVNDRCDLVAAGCCDGAQVGCHSLSPSLARRAVGTGWLGASCHDPEQLARAKAALVDVACLSPVWPTRSKPGHPGLGIELAGEWTLMGGLPTLWLGGVEARHAAQVAALPRARRPIGVAVMSAIAGAEDPRAAAQHLVQAWAASLSAADPASLCD